MIFLSTILLIAALFPEKENKLLTDPMVQNPTTKSVQIVWFTEFAGENSFVEYGDGFTYTVSASTQKMSRMKEDTKEGPKPREIWRHEARVLPEATSIPYRVVTVNSHNKLVKSDVFTCSALPQSGTGMKILLTSDHQLKPMVAANIEKAALTAKKIDAIFFAGDLVNHADKASEWFDEPTGGAFFPVLQGRASKELHGRIFKGAPLLQSAPLFPAIGNHEVMGRVSDKSLDEQFNDAYPIPGVIQESGDGKEAPQNVCLEQATIASRKARAKTDILGESRCSQNRFSNHERYREKAPDKNQSFNSDTYEEMFSVPKYYAKTVGDVRLIVLDITRIWRTPKEEGKGKYTEASQDPLQWGFGEFIFEPIAKGSEQYQWLEQELHSEEYKNAKYKIVMFHHPMHSLGTNVTPPFTNPVQIQDGETIRYAYPKEQDYLIRDIEPLLIQNGVQLVFSGHNHIWNRFQAPSGMHYLETSNVGNTNSVANGDPNGLKPILPSIAPLKDENGTPQPYIASNEITAFSLLDTTTGTIDSYYLDTKKPFDPPIHFDRFQL